MNIWVQNILNFRQNNAKNTDIKNNEYSDEEVDIFKHNLTEFSNDCFGCFIDKCNCKFLQTGSQNKILNSIDEVDKNLYFPHYIELNEIESHNDINQFSFFDCNTNFNSKSINSNVENIGGFNSSILCRNKDIKFKQNKNKIDGKLNNELKNKRFSGEICEICLSSFKNKSTKNRHYKKEHIKIKIIPKLTILNKEPIFKEKIHLKNSKIFVTDGVNIYSKNSDSNIFKKEQKYNTNLHSSCIYDINANNGLELNEIIENNQIELSSTQLPKFLKKLSHFSSYFNSIGLYRLKTEKFSKKNITDSFNILCQNLQNTFTSSKSELILNLKQFSKEFLHQLNDSEMFMCNLAKHEKNISVDRAIICFLNNNISDYSNISAIILIFSIMIFREFVNMKMISAFEEKNKKLIELLSNKIQSNFDETNLNNLEIFRNRNINKSTNIKSSCISPIYISPIKKSDEINEFENNIYRNRDNFNEILSLESSSQKIQTNKNFIEDFISRDILSNRIESNHKKNIADLLLFYNHNFRKSDLFLTRSTTCNSLPFYVKFFSEYLFEIEKENILIQINSIIKNICSNLVNDSVNIEEDVFNGYEKCDFLYNKGKKYNLNLLTKHENIILNRETMLLFVNFFMAWLKDNKYTIFELNLTNLVVETSRGFKSSIL